MSNDTLHVYEFGGCDWVAAANVDEAWEEWSETTGGSRLDYDDTFVVQLSDDKQITIHDENVSDDYEVNKTTLTCAEWAKINGRWFLASTET